MAAPPPSPRSAELRPLRTAELIDAAVEIARRDLGLYGGLAVIALGPLVLLAIRWAVAQGGPVRLDFPAHAEHALLLTVALLWRYVAMGASAIAVERHLAGEHPRLGPSLRAALGRGLSLAVAGALVVLVNLVLATIFFANVWLGWFALCAVPLCAERSASGAGSLGASRRLLSGLGGKAAALNALYLLLAALMMLNFMLGVHVLLTIGHVLFDVEVAWIRRFLSPANPFFWLISLGVSLTLLEPVRHLTSALLVWDARIRREAHDIRAVFAELARQLAARGRRGAGQAEPAAPAGSPPPAPPGAGLAPGSGLPPAPGMAPLPGAPPPPRFPGSLAGLLLVALLGAAAPARAAGDDPGDDGRQLVEIEHRARLISEPGAKPRPRGRYTMARQAEKLPPLEQRKLARFVGDAEKELARVQALPPGEARQRAAARLARRAETVAGAVGRLAARDAAGDPRRVAREVLQQPEFQVRPKEEPKPRGESWFDRLLRRLFKRQRSAPKVPATVPGLGGAFFKALTTVVLALGAALLILQIILWLVRRRREDDDTLRAPLGEDGAAREALPDPTTRTAAEWLADADGLAAAGDLRRAVRALYLALLSALCRRRLLRYDPARTNGEYVRSFRGPPEDRAVFRHVTLLSDAAIYGDFAPGADDYQQARALAIRLAAEGPTP